MNNRELKTIIKLFESSDLSRMRLEKEDVTIELEKPTKEVRTVPINSQTESTTDTTQSVEQKRPSKNTTEIKAPLVGTFYEAPAPDQPAFVQMGQTVKKGDTLCIIEAMKVMNEISAPRDGKIVDIHVENADMVMFDQLLMEIE